jgi:hypothetical protein
MATKRTTTSRIRARIHRILCFVLAAAVATSLAADEIIDRVLAVVAGDVIMLSDVRAARDLGLIDPGAAPDPDRVVLSQLIDRALILDEVERYAPPEPNADALERALNDVHARFRSDRDFDAALARVGLDDRQLHAMLRQNLRMRAYLDQRFAGETRERGEAIIAAWVAGLRSRAAIVDLYRPVER